MFTRIATMLAATALFAGAAVAHPKLVRATPAADAVVAAPARIELAFSEKLVPQFSSVDLFMTGMAGMTHPPMKVATTSSLSPDGKTLIATPARPLSAGTYRLGYKIVSADTHRVENGYSFSVK